MGVAPRDAEHYLSIIERRIGSNNGSRWMVEATRKLKKQYKTPDALKVLVATIYERERKHYTVDAWLPPRGDEYQVPKEELTVKDRMITRIITAQENDSAELVLKMMLWKDIHHAPILDDNLDLVGLLTWTDVQQYKDKPGKLHKSISDIMTTNLVTATVETPLAEAKELMKMHDIHCLPVVSAKKLVGIITSNDLDI